MLLAPRTARRRPAVAGRLGTLGWRTGSTLLRLLRLTRALHSVQQCLRLSQRGRASTARRMLCHLLPNHQQHGGRGSQRLLEHVHPDLQGEKPCHLLIQPLSY